MEYLSVQEIKERADVKKRIGEWISPTIKTGFSKYLVQKYITKSEPKLLDCGTASGEFAIVIKTLRPDAKIYGIDLEDYRTVKKEFENFYKVDLNSQKIPFEDNELDYITAWCVIPHLENPYNFVREAHRVLKKGGLFIFSIINTSSHGHRKYFYKTGEMPGFHERNNHIFISTPAIIKKTFLKYFDLTQIEYLISPCIFVGNRGLLRKVLHKVFPNWTRQRWGAKAFYILRK
ncbi:MAG: class I SAM-dependent methyltransferase [Patescibacteria group bacterium]